MCAKSDNDRKYTTHRHELYHLLNLLPEYVDKSAVTAAYARSTWKRIISAVKSAEKFAIHTNTHIEWPMSHKFLHTYTAWALHSHNISHSTVRAYIHDFSVVHKLKNLDHSNCNAFLLKTALKGAENLNLYSQINYEGKSELSFDLIRKIGSQIAKSTNTTHDKQVYWTALTTAVWGSFRMSEILAKNKHTCTIETLKWNDIEIFDNCISLHIKFPKVSKKGGDRVEIFYVKGMNCCPVKAMKTLKHMSNGKGLNSSPFTFENGVQLTQEYFTKALKIWASPYVSAEFLEKLSGHCCRNTIPRLLASRPDLACEDDIMVWGRWSSDAYKIYAKKSRMTRKIIFDKIRTAINSSLDRNADRAFR